MARGAFPSMTALLGLVAVAGYQNRDKISEMLGNSGTAGTAPNGTGGGLGGLLGGLLGGGAGGAGASGLGGLLSSFGGGAGQSGSDLLVGGGLSELTDHFRQNGHADTVDSWVGTGSNRDVAPHDLEQAIGSDTLDELTEQSGLTRDELLIRLSRELPKAVDQYTPNGQLPQAG